MKYPTLRRGISLFAASLIGAATAIQLFALIVIAGDVLHGTPPAYALVGTTTLLRLGATVAAVFRPRTAWVLVLFGAADWIASIVVFQMVDKHLSFLHALGAGTFSHVVFALAIAYWLLMRGERVN